MDRSIKIIAIKLYKKGLFCVGVNCETNSSIKLNHYQTIKINIIHILYVMHVLSIKSLCHINQNTHRYIFMFKFSLLGIYSMVLWYGSPDVHCHQFYYISHNRFIYIIYQRLVPAWHWCNFFSTTTLSVNKRTTYTGSPIGKRLGTVLIDAMQYQKHRFLTLPYLQGKQCCHLNVILFSCDRSFDLLFVFLCSVSFIFC